MTSSDMVRELCEKMNISLAELCRRIGQTPQNFNKKLKRGTVSFDEMMEIAEEIRSLIDRYVSEQNALGARYGALAYLLGFSDCVELMTKPLHLSAAPKKTD